VLTCEGCLGAIVCCFVARCSNVLSLLIVLPFCAIASHKHKNTNEALIEKEDGGGMMGRLACLDLTLYSRGTIFYWSCRLKSTKRSLMLTTVQGLNVTLYISVD
jgi:hypothetical protein